MQLSELESALVLLLIIEPNKSSLQVMQLPIQESPIVVASLSSQLALRPQSIVEFANKFILSTFCKDPSRTFHLAVLKRALINLPIRPGELSILVLLLSLDKFSLVTASILIFLLS